MSKKNAYTTAIHAGERQTPGDYIPVTTPIHSSSAFVYDQLETIDQIAGGQRKGFTYSRHDNPTTACLEEAVAALEDADLAVAYASGMAALHLAIMAAGVHAGSRIMAARDLYGVTYKLLLDVWGPMGVESRFSDTLDLLALAKEMSEFRPHLILLETFSNPLLRVCDLEAISKLARSLDCKIIVDNTFATPILVRPLTLGADFVVHSATKYMGGHGDVVGGVIATKEEFRQAIKYFSRLIGPVLGPFEAFLTRRGIKTMPLRMERHCANAMKLAEWLSVHPRVNKVNYPGLATHPDHALSAKLINGMFGGNVSFEIKTSEIHDTGREQVFRFINALKMVVPATSLGDIHSMVLYPAISSHRDLAPKTRQRLGINDNLVRVSVGIEDFEDIREDIAQALEA
jgi:cystathionine beta-lyase/cystathionine gamma-synthase